MDEKLCGPTTRSMSKKQKFLASSSPSSVGGFVYILDLGSASVWDFLGPQDVVNTLSACPGRFSPSFEDKVALQAVEFFAVENKTHLGRRCECDWMRRLDFVYQLEEECKNAAPFTVDKTLPILQFPGGPRAFLDALLLTKKLMQPFLLAVKMRDATFVPMVCPLVQSKNAILRTKAAVARAMDEICKGAGSRFFHKFKLSMQTTALDYLEYHWAGINGSSCEHCAGLTCVDAENPRKYGGLTRAGITHVRGNCVKLYRPLKATLEKKLQHVRFIRRPRRRSRREWSFEGKYKGLVAGITKGGVLCGLFVESGYWPHE